MRVVVEVDEVARGRYNVKSMAIVHPRCAGTRRSAGRSWPSGSFFLGGVRYSCHCEKRCHRIAQGGVASGNIPDHWQACSP